MMLKSACSRFVTRFYPLLVPFAAVILAIWLSAGSNTLSAEEVAVQTRRVNAPYMPGGVRYAETAIFWFGRVDRNSNYADVRVGYDDEKLWFNVSVIDRRIWYSPQLNDNPKASELANWDGVTLYLDVEHDDGSKLDNSTYQIVTQVTWWEEHDNYRAAYRGDGGVWTPIPFTFDTASGWRGNEPNDDVNDRGWTMTFSMPFAQLGLSGPPARGSVWRLGVALHDRDTPGGPPLPVQRWPENMDGRNPATWGELAFGLPRYTPPPSVRGGKVMIRHGHNGARVMDAHVGGGTVCGGPYGPDYFAGWGDANYGGVPRVNIQNLGDISDWPCFSKVYMTFPLDSVPQGAVIESAELVLHQFGGADVSKAKPSLIQVMTAPESWNESTITWNNAPLAGENVAATWVDVIVDFPGWPGVPVKWDVSGAVAEAHAAGDDLQLALYEADWALHSGKYFTTSEEEAWNQESRPTLEVAWGYAGFDIAVSPDVLHVGPGETVEYTIDVKHSPSAKESVQLASSGAENNLQVSLAPQVIAPPGGQAKLSVRNTSASSDVASTYHTIVITAQSGNVTQKKEVDLFVNGQQSYLPLVRQ